MPKFLCAGLQKLGPKKKKKFRKFLNQISKIMNHGSPLFPTLEKLLCIQVFILFFQTFNVHETVRPHTQESNFILTVLRVFCVCKSPVCRNVEQHHPIGGQLLETRGEEHEQLREGRLVEEVFVGVLSLAQAVAVVAILVNKQDLHDS